MQIAARILPQETFACHPQGYHLWLRLPPGVQASDLSHTLAAAGIGTIPSNRFAVRTSAVQALRVSLGGVAEKDALESALRALAGHLEASTGSRGAVI